MSRIESGVAVTRPQRYSKYLFAALKVGESYVLVEADADALAHEKDAAWHHARRHGQKFRFGRDRKGAYRCLRVA